MPRTRKWKPTPGEYATFVGRRRGLLHPGRRLVVVAYAVKRYMVVKAIGHKGYPVIFTVAAANLAEPQPDLFDGRDAAEGAAG